MGAHRRLIFHIGLEKTGTSSLQSCLHRNEGILARHSILYPKRNLAYGWENHKPLVGSYGIEEVGDKWLAVDPARRGRMVASLVDEIESSRHRTAIVSAEHFSSRFGARQIRELRTDFERFECHVVVVLRDHFSRLCSAYETYVSNGGPYPIEAFAEGLIRPGARDMRYLDLIAPWADVFGRDNVRLVAYGPDVVRDVLAGIAPGLGEEARLPAYRINVSVSPEVVAAMRFANQATLRPGRSGSDGNARWARESRLRAQLKTWLCEAARDEPAGAWYFHPELYARLNEIVHADVAALEANHDFVLDAPAYPEHGIGEVEVEGADLLARALHARAARPLSRASMSGTGLALALTLRDGLARVRGRLTRASAPTPRVT